VAQLIEFRCPTPSCNRLLFKVTELAGVVVEAKCPRCKSTATAQLEPNTEDSEEAT
jgi:phage FluMu protein Com